MTWAKFEHATPLNRKVVGLTDAAFRMWFEMICWSVSTGTDGRVSDDIPLARFASGRTPKKTVRELHLAGLLDRVEGAWEIHDFCDYQLSGAEQKVAKEKAAKRKRDERDRRRAALNGHFGEEPEP